MSSATLRTIIICLALLYFVSPIDLIPDRLGVFGRLDDLFIGGYLLWKTWLASARHHSGPSSEESRSSSSTSARDRSPFEVLEVERDASREEIEARYRELMKQYHPDRVAHLGKELQELAHEKTLEIREAYEALVGNT